MVTLTVTVSCALAEASDSIGVEITNDFYSKYIWRGQNINDDYVYQGGVNISYGSLTGSIWGNMDLTGITDNSGEFTEVDYAIDYSDSIEDTDIGYSFGLINYHFPSVVGDTTEIYWGASLEAWLSPSVTVYHDIDEVDGTYVSAGISETFEDFLYFDNERCADLEISLSVGWGDSDYNKAYWSTVTSSKINDLGISIALPLEIGAWTLTPSVNYVTLLSDDVRKSDAFRNESDYLFTGLSLSTSF